MPVITDSPRLKALKSAPLNSWIALSSDESSIVAVGTTYDEIAKKVSDSGLSDLVVLKTPTRWTSFSV
jgi:hypothetical protein